MNASLVSSTALSTGFILALSLSPLTHAVSEGNTSGAICSHYNADQANQIDYLPHGVRSRATSNTYVICPLSRDTRNNQGATAYVDIKHSSRGTTVCTLYSHSYTGNLLGSASKSWSGTGFKELTIPVEGTGKSNSYSDYAVVCRIPPNYKGMIMGVDLREW